VKLNQRNLRQKVLMTMARFQGIRSLALLVGIMVGVSCSPRLFAQASLASEDIIESLSVGKDSYTVVRDAIHAEQWYYVPNEPHLYSHQNGNKTIPEFHLLKYQFKDPQHPQKEIEAGLLQFSATLDVPAAAINDLRKQIASKKGVKPGDIRLAALPPKAAQVAVYAPKDGTLISADTFGSGNAPTFASQKMVFSIPLTQIGADVYDALVKGNTGVPVAVAITYGGLTPPAGFSVHVNWDLTYHHYSSDSKFAARASYFGLFGASYRSERQDVFNELTKDGSVKIDVIEGSGFKMQDIDKYLQPILQRINSEMVENMKPPDQVNPAAAPDPDAGGYFGGAGYSVSVKNETQRRHGTEDISFYVRQYQERVTAVSGFIGIGDYPEEVQKQLITIVPKGTWDKAYFLLPTMFNDPRLGIQGVDLEISLTNGSDKFDSELFKWKSDGDWKDKAGESRTVAFFPLLGLREKIGDAAYKNLNFHVQMKIIQRDVVALAERTIPVFDGETALASLPEMVEKIGFDCSGLSWNQLNSDSALLAVQINLKSGDLDISDTIRPRVVDGKVLPPEMWFSVVPRTSGQPAAAIAKVGFVLKGKDPVKWKYDGQDLRHITGVTDLKDIIFQDTDWQARK
jgi:hypothetical protein